MRQNFVVRGRPVDDYPNRPGVLPAFNFGSQTLAPTDKSSSETVFHINSIEEVIKG